INPGYPFPRLPYASAFLSLVLSSGAAARKANPAATKVQPPAHHKILQLRVIPSQVEFSNPREYRKILVAGKTDQAQEIDARDRKSTRLNSSHIPLSRMPPSS